MNSQLRSKPSPGRSTLSSPDILTIVPLQPPTEVSEGRNNYLMILRLIGSHIMPNNNIWSSNCQDIIWSGNNVVVCYILVKVGYKQATVKTLTPFISYLIRGYILIYTLLFGYAFIEFSCTHLLHCKRETAVFTVKYRQLWLPEFHRNKYSTTVSTRTLKRYQYC